MIEEKRRGQSPTLKQRTSLDHQTKKKTSDSQKTVPVLGLQRHPRHRGDLLRVHPAHRRGRLRRLQGRRRVPAAPGGPAAARPLGGRRRRDPRARLGLQGRGARPRGVRGRGRDRAGGPVGGPGEARGEGDGVPVLGERRRPRPGRQRRPRERERERRRRGRRRRSGGFCLGAAAPPAPPPAPAPPPPAGPRHALRLPL